MLRPAPLLWFALAASVALVASGCCFTPSPSGVPPAPPVVMPPVVTPPPATPVPVVGVPIPAVLRPGGGGVPAVTGADAPPVSWPADFPFLPGGTAQTAPPAGPVRVAIVSYAGSVDDIDARYHTALSEAGWTATPSEVAPRGAHRFTATHGTTSVSVSIFEAGGVVMFQTMQMGL